MWAGKGTKMWIRGEDYSRGYIHWVSGQITSLRVGQEPIDLTAAHTQADESFVLLQSELGLGLSKVDVRFVDGAPMNETLCWMEWIDAKGDVQCRMWTKDPQGVVESSSVYAPGLGQFHRLVIDGSGINWEGERVYRHQDLIVRFCKGRVYGHTTSTGGSTGTLEGQTATMKLGPQEYDGQFIEIITKGESDRDAKRNAYGIAGYIALIFGRTVVGTVIFDSGISMSKMDGLRETVAGKVEFFYVLTLPETAFEVGLSGFDQLADSSRKAATHALERFAQAKRTKSDELQLAAHFSGIEILVNAFVREQGGVPDVEARYKKHEKAFTKFLDMVGDKDLKKKILGSLKHSPIQTSFEFYIAENQLKSDDFESFKKIAEVRNKLFHSGTVAEIHELNQAAMRILQRMLEHELGMNPNTSWNKYPLFEIVAPLSYPNYGWNIPWNDSTREVSLDTIDTTS